jgi:hypothetical protein
MVSFARKSRHIEYNLMLVYCYSTPPPPPASLHKIHSDTFLPSTTRSSEWSLSFGLYHLYLVQFSLLSHAQHMSHPPHSPWLDLPSDIWWWVQIIKLLIVQIPPSPVTSSLVGPDILLRTMFSDTLRLCPPLNMRDHVSRPYVTTGRIMVLYVLTFTFLVSCRKENDSQPMVAIIYWILSALYLFFHAVLIC